MILSTLKEAEQTWREIARLATPLDSNKPVILGTKPRQGDLEAYTDDKSIFINVDENKFKKNFQDIIIPAYNCAANKLYRITPRISDPELLENLVFDNFLFVHFHEQLHPQLCPNSKEDKRKITAALYEGIRKAEPSLSRTDAFLKVNNSKNLIWDVVLNVSFLSKTAGFNNDDLEEKISNVFIKKNRKIAGQPIEHYPQGILPIVYIISANNRTTDIPISLVGAMYTTLSFNDLSIRQNALDFFLQDLSTKKIPNQDTLKLIKEMYTGFVSEIDANTLDEARVDKNEFINRVKQVDNLSDAGYEKNQEYFISALTRIFDTPSTRYNLLKGFIKVLSPYLRLDQKQGSPDPNSKGSGESDGDPSDSDSNSGDPGDSSDSGGDKSQEEMDGDSMSDTLDDLLGELGKKEADGLLGEVANSHGNRNAKKINILAADEYYKRNADVIEVRNPLEQMVSFDLGTKKRWKLVRTDTLTPADVSRLNHSKIITFQKATGLPVLMESGAGFFRLNQYVLEETPQKSYSFQKSGIEIPDNWVFIQDSSSSMGGINYIGSGCKFDLLNRVKYGLQKGLYQVCKDMKKDLQFGVVDFSDQTRYSGLDSLVKIYESRNHPIKQVSLSPQCGGTTFNSGVFPRIKKDLAPGKSIYTFVTDGDIMGDTARLYDEIEKFASEKDNAFVFVEIQSASGFGQSIHNLSKRNDSVLYYNVNSVKSIKDKLEKVLIKYG